MNKLSVFAILICFGFACTNQNTEGELYDARSDSDRAIAATEEPSGEDIREVFRHYLDLVKGSRARVFIVSAEFDAVLKSDDYSGEAWGNIEDYYTGD